MIASHVPRHFYAPYSCLSEVILAPCPDRARSPPSFLQSRRIAQLHYTGMTLSQFLLRGQVHLECWGTGTEAEHAAERECGDGHQAMLHIFTHVTSQGWKLPISTCSHFIRILRSAAINSVPEFSLLLMGFPTAV